MGGEAADSAAPAYAEMLEMAEMNMAVNSKSRSAENHGDSSGDGSGDSSGDTSVGGFFGNAATHDCPNEYITARGNDLLEEECTPSMAPQTPTSSLVNIPSLIKSSTFFRLQWFRNLRDQLPRNCRIEGVKHLGKVHMMNVALGAIFGGGLVFCGLILYAALSGWNILGSPCSSCTSNLERIHNSFRSLFSWFCLFQVKGTCLVDIEKATSEVDVWSRLRELGVITKSDEYGIMDLMLINEFAKPRSNSTLNHSWRQRRRHLESNPSSSPMGPPLPMFKGSKAKLVIAGKMIVEEGQCNIAQFDMGTGYWSLTERIQLSLYNSYSGGEVYMMIANHTLGFGGSGSGDYEHEDDSSLIWPKARCVISECCPLWAFHFLF